MAELAWPADLGHGTFTGRFGFMDADSHDEDREPDITSATGGTVTITPSIKSVRYTGVSGPMSLAARPAKGVIDAEGYLCTMNAEGAAGDRGMVFPATDDTDLTPTDWTYSVLIVLDGGVRLPSFSVKLPAGATVDLSLAVPVDTSGGTAVVVDPTTATRAEAAATRAETAADEAEGYAPSFVWDGTALVIDGEPGPDLKGDKGTTAWDDLTGKPATYPPAAHTHPITDVTGLQAIIDRLTYSSGWRNITSLLIPDYLALNPNSTAYISRIGNEVTINFSQGTGATASGLNQNVLPLPSGFRTTGQARPWGSPGLDEQTGKQVIDGSGLYLDTSGWRVNLNATPGKRYSFTMRWTTHEDPPTSTPGTPA